jgi:hypothetical protein
MSGAIPPLPNNPSWCGARLKEEHRDNITFTYTFTLWSTGYRYFSEETGHITSYLDPARCNVTKKGDLCSWAESSLDVNSTQRVSYWTSDVTKKTPRRLLPCAYMGMRSLPLHTGPE